MIKCSLFVLALAFIGTASASFTLEDFCKGQPVELKFIRDVEFLITSFQNGPTPGCSERTRQSILDLEPIISANNVCSQDVAKKIGHYYAKYVSKKRLSSWLISKSTREFFLALSFEISRVCEQALLDNLKNVTNQKITPTEALEVLDFNDNLNDLASIIGGDDMRIQDLFLVTNMDGIVARKFNEPKLYNKETIAVSRNFKKKFDRVKALCGNKFKPIYEKLFTPLVILTNVGFEYTSGQLDILRYVFRDSYDYWAWYTGVLMCEAILAQSVIEAPETSNLFDDDESMTFLDEDEVERLEQESGLDSNGEPLVETRQEYDLIVRLDRDTDFTSDELRREAKTVSKKRKEAKKLRKLVYKRLTNSFVEVMQSDKIHIGLNSDWEMGPNHSESEPVQRKHWVKRWLLWTLPVAAIASCAISPGMGAALAFAWLALLFARVMSPRYEWH